MTAIEGTEKKKPTYSCCVCDAKWTSKKNEGLPQRCPRCKSKLWNACFKHTCAKCGYGWQSSNVSPDRCPQCQTKKWKTLEDNETMIPASRINSTHSKQILLRYNAGMGCVKIAVDLGITFDEVYEVIRSTYSSTETRI